MASLVVTEGPARGKMFALDRHAQVLVGRDDECTFQVLDEHVSRRHLKVRFDDKMDCHFASDFKSANGVSVNGRTVFSDVLLEDGDAIVIGGTTIVYSHDDFDDAETAMTIMHQRGERWRSTISERPGESSEG